MTHTTSHHIHIAAILTCFNRKEKTLSCLRHLYHALSQDDTTALTVYLTDDGCTDGTAEAVRNQFPDKDIHILQGTGSLYWAGGMIFAWKEALKQRDAYDFYLLLNDDSFVKDNVFKELYAAHAFSLQTYGMAGIYSGVTCDPNDESLITYGGGVYENASRSKIRELKPTGQPQMVDKTNANILLVSRQVVDSVGIFYDGYIHSGPDFDYSLVVRKAGFPALITANVCGTCEFDHTSDADICEKLRHMTLKERIAYLENPLHREHDYLVFVKRHNPKKYPVTWMLHKIRRYCPSIYLFINRRRGLY